MRTMYNLDTLLDTIKVSDDEDVYTSNGLKNLKTEMVNFEKENLDIHVHNVSLEHIIIYKYVIESIFLLHCMCINTTIPVIGFNLSHNFIYFKVKGIDAGFPNFVKVQQFF